MNTRAFESVVAELGAALRRAGTQISELFELPRAEDRRQSALVRSLGQVPCSADHGKPALLALTDGTETEMGSLVEFRACGNCGAQV